MKQEPEEIRRFDIDLNNKQMLIIYGDPSDRWLHGVARTINEWLNDPNKCLYILALPSDVRVELHKITTAQGQ